MGGCRIDFVLLLGSFGPGLKLGLDFCLIYSNNGRRERMGYILVSDF